MRLDHQQPDPLKDQRRLPTPLLPADLPQNPTAPWPASCQRAVSVSPTQSALRTPAWFLHQGTTDDPPKLFVKPDDRWEVNDVANRCPEIVEQMVAQWEICREFYQRQDDDGWPPLPELLANRWE